MRKAAPYVLLMCCAVCLVLFAPKVSAANRSKLTVYKQIVPIDSVTLRNENLCVPLEAFLTSGDFFDGLEAAETPSGRKFHKNSQEITEYPDEITLLVRARTDCSTSPYDPADPMNSKRIKDFILSLSFSLDWQTQLDRKPIEGFSTDLLPPPSSVLADQTAPAWSYVITLNTKGVPLTDHLVITVHSGADKFVTRMAVHL